MLKTYPNPTPCTEALWQWSQSHPQNMPVIPDLKARSPGEGELFRGRDPIVLAKDLAQRGAPVLSVVTESEHYGGSPDMLLQIAKATSLPIIRKDFITNKTQLAETEAIGASGVLLIASMLTTKQLIELIEEAWRLGLEPLVETHNKAEIVAVNELAMVTFLGINNRNILKWETDDGNVKTTEELASLANPDVFVLSESSIFSPEDARRALKAGAHGVLVGTAILQADDPVDMYSKLTIL